VSKTHDQLPRGLQFRLNLVCSAVHGFQLAKTGPVASRASCPPFHFAFATSVGNLRATMTPEEVPSPSGPTGNSPRPRSRSRRGGRGRRRPAPRTGAPVGTAPVGEAAPGNDAQAPQTDAAETFSAREETFSSADAPEHEPEDAPRRFDDHDQPPESEGYETEPPEHREEPREYRAEPPPRDLPPPREPRRVIQPASPAAVTEAIVEVNGIITKLRESLDTMDEILETLELAEVQKTADEREIQALRNAMRGFDRPSGEPRRESRGDDRRRGRR
jgi:hypothetical protein